MKTVLKILTEPVIDHSFSIRKFEKENMLHTEYFVRLNYHHILMVENGVGQLKVDGHSFTIAGHNVFLLSKGQIYQFEDRSSIEGYCISFGDCFWEKTPSSASNCKAVLFNNAAAHQLLEPHLEMNGLLELSKVLWEEFNKPLYTNQMDVMAAYLKIIMIKLANVKLVEEDTFDSQDYIVYRKFMDLLSNQQQYFHAVSDYAEMLNITSRRLSDLCKRCSNKSAKEIIIGQVVAEAKRLLQFSPYPVKEIAYQLNFGTPEQFSHFFKKNAAVSPMNYRKEFISIGTEA